jgi:hypothetical protein
MEMRGVLSFLIILAALPVMFTLLALGSEISSKTSFAERSALALERRYYADLEFKEALEKTLHYASGANREDAIRNGAEALAALEGYVEQRLRENGVEADVWAGAVSESEVDAMKERILVEGRPLKCLACFDLSAYAVDWRGRPVRRASGLLDFSGGRLAVSRNGLANVPELEDSLNPFSGAVAVGVSMYFPKEKIAAVALVREGFGGGRQ